MIYSDWESRQKQLLRIDILYFPRVSIEWEKETKITKYQLRLYWKNRWEQVYLKNVTWFRIFFAILRAIRQLKKVRNQENRTKNFMTHEFKTRTELIEKEYTNFLSYDR